MEAKDLRYTEKELNNIIKRCQAISDKGTDEFDYL